MLAASRAGRLASLSVARLGAAYGRPATAHFADEALDDPLVRRLMGKASYYVHSDLQTDESITREFSEVVVRLRGGRELARRVLRTCNKGSAGRPLTDDELAEKFRECAGRGFSGPRVDALLVRLRRFSEEADVAGLAASLAG